MGLVGLASHAPVPFLDKATSSIWVGTDDVLLYHCLLTRQNVVFIQGFGGEKEGKQAKVGTTQVPEYVWCVTCQPGVSACRQGSKNTLVLPSCSVHVLPSWSRSHLHCEDESSAVEGIFPVQGPIQG